MRAKNDLPGAGFEAIFAVAVDAAVDVLHAPVLASEVASAAAAFWVADHASTRADFVAVVLWVRIPEVAPARGRFRGRFRGCAAVKQLHGAQAAVRPAKVGNIAFYAVLHNDYAMLEISMAVSACVEKRGGLAVTNTAGFGVIRSVEVTS